MKASQTPTFGRLAGVPAMILASFAFATMAAFVKAVGQRLPAIELVFLRCLLALPLMAVLLRSSGQPLRAVNRAGIGLRSVFGLFAMTLSFYGLARLDLVDQMMLSKTTPLWIAVLAPLVLSENANRVTWWAVAVSLIGSALVLRPSLAVGNLAGAAVLGGALASALAHMMLRRLSATDPSTTIVFWFCLVTAALTAPFALVYGSWPTPQEWLLMAGVAVAATVGQLLMTHAYAVEEAPVVSASGYINVVFAMVLGLVFWREVPSLWSFAGGILIVCSGLVLALYTRRPAQPYRLVRAHSPSKTLPSTHDCDAGTRSSFSASGAADRNGSGNPKAGTKSEPRSSSADRTRSSNAGTPSSRASSRRRVEQGLE